MAQEPGGQRPDHAPAAPWTKLFSAFRLAISPSKLLLAAAGILTMAVGWWLLAFVFFGIRSKPPMPADYLKGQEEEKKEEAFTRFKAARNSWNLLNELAGSAKVERDAGDLAQTAKEFEIIQTLLGAAGDVRVQKKEGVYNLAIGNRELIPFTSEAKIPEGQPVRLAIPDAKRNEITVAGQKVTLVKEDQFAAVKEYLTQGQKAAEYEAQERKDKAAKNETEVVKAFKNAEVLLLGEKRYKPFGYLRTWPWDEYRGPNPYLVVTNPATREEYRKEFLGVQVPVLLEPLVKFVSPLVYFLQGEAGIYIKLYLFLVILWTLATWALFGGAITRIAVVQAARPTERVGLIEAVRFARSRFQSFFSAPLIPLVFVAVLLVFMMFFGFIMGVTVFLGDIFLAVIFWPLIFLLALVMAMVLVGLVGWPLMYTTISAEGSDSFDALSRSYSYVFQAVWRYVGYGAAALAYGVVLVFFVGFMGSLVVYLGKWGVSQTPFLGAMNREPTYFFAHAPKSFGWRDLLLHDSPNAAKRPWFRPNGTVAEVYGLKDSYRESFSFWNHVGAVFVTFWLYLLFLLVVGFGYSYFWCASSIIYLLMRWHVDETEFDEVHLEEEEEPLPEMPEPAPTATPAGTPGFTMVETPALRTGTASGAPAAFPANTSGGEGNPASPTGSPGFDGGAPPPNS